MEKSFVTFSSVEYCKKIQLENALIVKGVTGNGSNRKNGQIEINHE